MSLLIVLLGLSLGAVAYYVAQKADCEELRTLDLVAAELGLRRTQTRLEGAVDGIEVEAAVRDADAGYWMTYSARPLSMPSMRVDVRRRGKRGGVATGDPSFDEVFRVRDADPMAVAWLTRQRRTALIELADEATSIELRKGRIIVRVDGRIGQPAPTVALIRRIVDVAHGR